MLLRILDLLYPRECEICQARLTAPELDILCPGCDARVEWIEGRTCRRCGWGIADDAEDDRRCPECDGKEIAFKSAVAAGRYAGYVRELVQRFKFRRQVHLARPFGRRLARRLRETAWLEGIDLLVPVPTPLGRILDRRYSAAEVMAMRLSSELEKPWARALTLSGRARASQTELSGAERLKNPVGAFKARPKRVRDRLVLLVDDVLTTGATANECTRVLRDAGAKQVYLAVIGR